MIQNLHDIHKLIKSPAYKMPYDPNHNCKSYDLFNNTVFNERIHVEICDKYIEIYKTNNMSYEYYENIVTTNKRGNEIAKQFKKTLMAKRAVARIKMVSEKRR